jgi:hypothetical protein
MTQGAHIPALGCYLLVERSGEKIKRVRFSQVAPLAHCELAEEIVAYLEGKGPCPQAELDVADLTDFQKQIYAIRRQRGQWGGPWLQILLWFSCPAIA